MISLHRLQNVTSTPLTVQPIDRLPSEILVKIFDILPQDDGIKSSHTCAYWHDLFWTTRKVLHLANATSKTLFMLLSLPKLTHISVAANKNPIPFLQALNNIEGFDTLKIQLNPNGGYYPKNIIRRYLIGEELAIGSCNNLKNTSLHFAIEHNQNDLLPLLLENDLNLEQQNVHFCTPLMWALEKQNLEAVLILIDAGADVNTKKTFENLFLAKVCLHAMKENELSLLKKTLTKKVDEEVIYVVKKAVKTVQSEIANNIYTLLNAIDLGDHYPSTDTD